MKRAVILAVMALGCINDSCVTPVAWESCVVVVCLEGYGSGSVVSRHFVLTAAHVAEDAVAVRLQDGTVLPVLASVPHTSEDAAILIVAGELPVAMAVSFERLQRGDEIMTIGAPYSEGLQGHMLFGRVANVDIPCTTDHSDPNASSVNDVLDLNVGPGISGAPVVKGGHVVGIVVGLTNGYATMLPTMSFRDLLRP